MYFFFISVLFFQFRLKIWNKHEILHFLVLYVPTHIDLFEEKGFLLYFVKNIKWQGVPLPAPGSGTFYATLLHYKWQRLAKVENVRGIPTWFSQ